MPVVNRALRADSERTRRQILDTARDMCRADGYENIRMADIADRVGRTRATVYNHFATRDDLLQALCEEYLHGFLDLFEGIRDWLSAEHTIFDVLRETVAGELRWRVDHAELRGALDSARRLRAPFYVEAERRIDEAVRGWFQAIYQAARAHGQLRPDLDVEFASRPVYAMVDSVVRGFPVRVSSREVERSADQVARLQWHALFEAAPEDAPLFVTLEIDLDEIARAWRSV